MKVEEVGIEHFPRRHGTQSGASLNVIWASVMGLVFIRRRLNQGTTLAREAV
jgi:hypothetical protein